MMGMQSSSSVGTDGYGWRTHSTEGDDECPWSSSNEQKLFSAERDTGEWWTKRLEQAMIETGTRMK